MVLVERGTAVQVNVIAHFCMDCDVCCFETFALRQREHFTNSIPAAAGSQILILVWSRGPVVVSVILGLHPLFSYFKCFKLMRSQPSYLTAASLEANFRALSC